LSSLISLLLAFSKFSFFLTDYPNPIFHYRLGLIIKNNENETLKATRENAIFMAIMITRFFHYSTKTRIFFETLTKPYLDGSCSSLHTNYITDKLYYLNPEHKIIKIAKKINVILFKEPTISQTNISAYIEQKESVLRSLTKEKQQEIISLWNTFFEKKEKN